MTIAPWPAKETMRLAKLQDYDILDTLPEPAYDDIVILAARICQSPTALISLIDAKRQWFKAKVGLDIDETPRSLSLDLIGNSMDNRNRNALPRPLLS